MNVPKTHDNRRVQSFLSEYENSTELCEEHPKADDIFSGVLALKTARDTATRSLSRRTLFHLLQWCDSLDVFTVNQATNGRYSYRTVAGYTSAARVASKAFAGLLDGMPEGLLPMTIKQECLCLDAPYLDDLRQQGLI